jgi:hypothetical protein
LLIGQLDGVTRGQVFGWAMDNEHPESPVLLTLRSGGRAIATVLAASHRADVATAHGTRGYHGFTVDIAAVLPGGTTASVEVRLPNGHHVPRSPVPVSIPRRARTGLPLVIFMHIPKTAGTVFREAIEVAYLPPERLHLYPHDTYYPGDFSPWQLPLDERARIGFVAGHVSVGIHEAFPREAEYITLLRPPFDRVRSHYLHVAREMPASLVVAGRRRTLAEVLADPHDAAFDNLMVRYFAGEDPHTVPPGTIGAAHLERALENMRRHFRFVGQQAHADRVYGYLRTLYGWNSAPSLHWGNVGGTTLPDAEDEPAREAAARREHWDAQLCEEAVRLFGEP